MRKITLRSGGEVGGRPRLDDALSIMVDPHRLFIEAPDPIKLMLTQAIFDKLWVMDHEVVGSELTDTYHELLTMEARLTLDEQARTEPAADSLSIAPAAHTYYRRRTDRSEDLSGQDQDDELADLARRLWIERPRGVLFLDSKNPVLPEARRGSDVSHLVGVLRRYSNRPDLLEQLRRVGVILSDGGQGDGVGAEMTTDSVVRSRRLLDRFSSEDLHVMIDTYRSGTTARQVAEKFGVSLRSVKRLLHRHGVRRERRGGIQFA